VMYGPMAAFIAELFDTRLRTSGASFGYQVAAIFGGAPAPLIATLLIERFHTTFAVTVYVALTAVLACVSALLARETRDRQLAEDFTSSPAAKPAVEGAR
jgi:MFS family permease